MNDLLQKVLKTQRLNQHTYNRPHRRLGFREEPAEWNAAHNPHFRTELIPSNGEHAHVSSTMVREKLQNGESPEGLVADAALPLLYQKP